MTQFPLKKYAIIYADPPWNSNSQFGRDKNRGNEQHYPLMATEDIKRLPVPYISDKNCVLLLWVVDTQLPDALEVIKAWGFTYKTVAFTWVKKTTGGKDHFGVGQWTRKNPEMCLLATKGNPQRINADIRQLQRHFVREHSQKPDAIRNEIVRLCGDIPRIELFARNQCPGWDSWGNDPELDNTTTQWQATTKQRITKNPFKAGLKAYLQSRDDQRKLSEIEDIKNG